MLHKLQKRAVQADDTAKEQAVFIKALYIGNEK